MYGVQKKSFKKLLPISSGTYVKCLKMAAVTLQPQIWNHEITNYKGVFNIENVTRMKISAGTEI